MKIVGEQPKESSLYIKCLTKKAYLKKEYKIIHTTRNNIYNNFKKNINTKLKISNSVLFIAISQIS